MFNPNIKILVVDDMMVMRKIVAKALSQFGFKDIVEADDGETAWATLQKMFGDGGRFDLIISDWNMPKMKGIELLKKVRADERMKDLPFLMVTAESEKEIIVDAIKSGVSHYVVKPVAPATLEGKLKEVWAKHNK